MLALDHLIDEHGMMGDQTDIDRRVAAFREEIRRRME